MKDQQRQFVIGFYILAIVSAVLFGLLHHAETERKKVLRPCSEYDHLHESMQPVRCGKE